MAISHRTGSNLWTITPVGDGQNDSPQVQTALTAASTGPDASSNSVLQFSRGSFWFNDMVYASGFRGQLQGQGTDKTKFWAGTSTGGPMNLVDPVVAETTTRHRFPSMFLFHEVSTSHVGTNVQVNGIAFETVNNTPLPLDAPNLPIYFTAPWYNRNCVSFLFISGKVQTLPINYSGGGTANVGFASLNVSNCTFKGHLSGPYAVDGNQPASNVDECINYDDHLAALGPNPYTGDPTVYGVFQADPAHDPMYFYYTGPDIPRCGDIVLNNVQFIDTSLGLFSKNQWSRPASQPGQFYVFDGSSATSSHLTLNNVTFTRCGFSPGGGVFDALTVGGAPGTPAQVNLNNVNFVDCAGCFNSSITQKVNGVSPTYGGSLNFPWDSTTQSSPTVVVQNSDMQTVSVGPDVLTLSGDVLLPYTSILVNNVAFEGVPTNGSELNLTSVNNVIVENCRFEQTAKAPAIFVDNASTNVSLARSNKFGVKADPPPGYIAPYTTSRTSLQVQYLGSGQRALDIMLTYPRQFIRHTFSGGELLDVTGICTAEELNRNDQWTALRNAGTFALVVTPGLNDTGDVTPAKLALETSGLGVPIVLRTEMTSGGTTGVADDVDVFDADVPFGFRVLKSWALVTTAAGGSTLTVRSETGGGGSAMSGDVPSATTGPQNEGGTNASLSPVAAKNGSVFIHRSDRSVTGEFFMLVVRE